MNEKLLEYFKSDDIHLVQCEHKWCNAYGYEKSQMKKDILDYITNLQQLYENGLKVNQNTEKYRTELESKYVLLQQENETLKEQNNDLRKIYRNTYKRLFENGNDELARYFQAQIDRCPTFYAEPIIDYAKEYKIYKSRCEKANDFIDNYDVFKEFSFPLMKRDIENQIKSSIDYEFNSTFRTKFKNILNGDDENEYK